MISEFNFSIRYIEGKENRMVGSLSMQVHVTHLEIMSSYGIDLQDRILQASQEDVGIGAGAGTRIGIGTGGSTGTSTGIGIGATAQGMDYCLTSDGLVKFRDSICVPNNSELKKVILR